MTLIKNHKMLSDDIYANFYSNIIFEISLNTYLIQDHQF